MVCDFGGSSSNSGTGPREWSAHQCLPESVAESETMKTSWSFSKAHDPQHVSLTTSHTGVFRQSMVYRP